MQCSFGVDLTGVWVTLGGASLIVGFATKDILANFFSGLGLLSCCAFKLYISSPDQKSSNPLPLS
ncbi:mechanosensitive ion channel, partial [Microcoleus sp. D2B6]